MLTQLRIANYAIIEQIELELDPGFNVLTGETGAGKSIIVGAAALIRGGRATADAVRTGAKQAEIEAIFDIASHPHVNGCLDELGLPRLSDGELLVRRVVSRNGRGRVYVNGSLCTVGILARITGPLLDIAGQHEHQSLSQREAQLGILDDLARTRTLRQTMSDRYDAVLAAAGAHRSLLNDSRNKLKQIDFLRYQVGEIEDAQLSADEDTTLESRHRRLSRAAELYQVASAAEQALYGMEGAVTEQLASHGRRLSGLARVDEALAVPARQLDEARLQIEDAALTLGRYAEGLDLDPAGLEELEQRLVLVHRLKRKHGATIAEILERAGRMRQDLDDLEAFDTRVDELAADLDRAREEARACAEKLDEARRKAARRLTREASKHLQALCMEGARLEVKLEHRPPQKDDDPALVIDGVRRLGPTGWDRVALLIAANAGEEPRPLSRVASGGELSRVMLALRQVVGRYDPLSTSIYDEVDAGIGGQTADVVGRCLAEVARHRQVLCVTHLPQVAAHASRHFHVGKRRTGRRSVTAAEQLSSPGQVDELARMLGGQRVTKQARANAAQLLAAAHQLED